jgi:hypothetical protein
VTVFPPMRVALEAWVAWGFLQGRNGLSRVFPRRERSVAERVEERLPLADRFAREFLEAWLSGALAAVAWALFVTASDAELSATRRRDRWNCMTHTRVWLMTRLRVIFDAWLFRVVRCSQ